MARRGDYSKPKLNARQRFQQKQQNNRIIAQLEQMYQSGMSVEEVRATHPRNRTQQVTIADGDNLSTIAANNGTTETDILNANPLMNAPRPGMVINVPGANNQRRTLGGVGMPTAALGAPSGGLSTFQDPRDNAGRGTNANYNMPGVTTPRPQTWIQQAAAMGTPNAPRVSQGVAGIAQHFIKNELLGTNPNFKPYVPYNERQLPTPIPYAGSIAATAQNVVGHQQTDPWRLNAPVRPAVPTAARPRQFAPRGNHVTMLDSITNQIAGGKVPTELEMKLLINSGRIKPAKQGGGGGYGPSANYRRFGGGGGGGNRRQGGGNGYQQEPRLPAFSNGASFRGLVNWRV